MIVANFYPVYHMYDNMQLWEVNNKEQFFKTNEQLAEIFAMEYGFPYAEINETNFKDELRMLVTKLLDYFEDKSFFVFEKDDQSFLELYQLQHEKKVNFGIDLMSLMPEKVYVMEMDKTQDLQKYDTL
jgi:hypothetical protein